MSTRACDTGFVEISADCSGKSALRSFSAHKRWVDKHLGKVYSLMNLLDKQFDRRSEEKCEELLSKAENQIAALLQYSEFLTQKKYEKAKEHLEEVDKLEADIEKVWDLFNKTPTKGVLSCLVLSRSSADRSHHQGDRAVTCHPMVPTAWPPNGPKPIIGAALPCVSWADNLLGSNGGSDI